MLNIHINMAQGRPRLKKAIADAYSPFFGKEIDPETEVTITTGANEGMLSAFMAFVEPGDEVVLFEPFFDQYAFRSPNLSNLYLVSRSEGTCVDISPTSKWPAARWSTRLFNHRRKEPPRRPPRPNGRSTFPNWKGASATRPA